VVAFVPAKGSSERIENKNAKLLDGRPLVVHTLDRLLKCQNVDEVYLDTESDEIARLARHLPVKIMQRNRFLASNGTDGHALFMNEVRHADADIYVQALCTAPFGRAGPEGKTVSLDRGAAVLWLRADSKQRRAAGDADRGDEPLCRPARSRAGDQSPFRQ
jgi:hypothetical protein